MGTYHPNPQEVINGNIGRRLEDAGDSYESYTTQLEADEQLWLATDNGSWDLVILLDNPEEFQYVTTRREGKGEYVFYAIPIG